MDYYECTGIYRKDEVGDDMGGVLEQVRDIVLITNPEFFAIECNKIALYYFACITATIMKGG